MKQKHLHQSVALRFKRFAGKSYSAFNTMHKVINIGALTGVAVVCAYTSTAKAQNVGGTTAMHQEGEEKELEGVVVTASKLETPLSQVAKLVTVITAKDLATAPVRSIQDLLNYAAGVDVVQRGGHGVQADISIRGGSHDQTIVLLNGINLNNSETGHLSFDIPINLSDIERIEIIHGPAALIYGIGAFSGGINIITRHEVAEKILARVTAGMHGLVDAEARGAYQWGKLSTSLSLGTKRSDGYRDNTDYQISNLFLQSDLRIDPKNKLHLQLGANKKAFGANSFYTNKFPMQYEYTQRYTGALRGELGTGSLRLVPQLYWDRAYDQFDLIKGTTTGQNHHIADNYGAGLALSYLSSLGTTSLAGEYRREDIVSSKLGHPRSKPEGKYTQWDSRTNLSLSVEHSLSWQSWALSAGLMVNHNTLRSGRYDFFPSISLTYRPDEHWSFSSTWSQSTRLPSFVDFYYTTETHQGNGNLLPEKSRSLEVGAKYRDAHLSAYVTAFGIWGNNLIDWVKVNPTDKKWSSWNLSQSSNYGIEAGFKLRLQDYLPFLGKGSQLQVDYVHMHRKHQSAGMISRYAEAYLRDKLTAQLSHSLFVDQLTANWYLRTQKRMGVYESGVVNKVPTYSPYPAFATLDLKMEYQFSKAFVLSANLNNLTNTHYFDIGSIPQPGFWASMGLTYRLW